MTSRSLDRRTFLGSAAAVPLVAPVHGVLGWLPTGGDRSLVVLELEGGNDGLNTILPLEDAAWHDARPQLSTVRHGAHVLAGGFALHPELSGVHRLMRDGLAAAVHGVGYPKPSRSHFKSRDVWHTADVGFTALQAGTTGWLGRVADLLAARGAAVPGLSVGGVEVPLMLASKRVVVPSVRRIEDYQLSVCPGGERDARRRQLAERVRQAQSGGGSSDDLRAFLGAVAKSAVDNAEKLRGSLASYREKARYPDTALGRKLRLLARIVVSGFGTRLFHVNFAGFDTHARQLPAHAALLRQFSQAVTALVQDLRGHGKLDDVLIVAQSEFGRRVAQNRSGGTDHGKAGPVFLFGSAVVPGLHGRHPSLTDLDDGDLRHTTDFRAIYAAALRWLGIAPATILGRDHPGVHAIG